LSAALSRATATPAGTPPHAIRWVGIPFTSQSKQYLSLAFALALGHDDDNDDDDDDDDSCDGGEEDDADTVSGILTVVANIPSLESECGSGAD
jgi:hypothetical protein